MKKLILSDQIREIKRLEFCANKLYTFVFLVDNYKFGVKKIFNKLPKNIMTYLLVKLLFQLD